MQLKRTVSALCMMGCLILSAAENLIPNPALDILPGSQLPKGWYTSADAQAVKVNLQGNIPALQISETDAKKKSFWIARIPGINVNQVYRLTVSVEGKKGTQGRIYVESDKPWKTFITPAIVCDGSKKKVILDFKFDKLEKNPYVVLRQDSPGEITFSELKLEVYTPSLLKNSEFADLKGWQIKNDAVVKIQKIDGKGNGVSLSAGKQNNPFIVQWGIPLRAEVEYNFSVEFKGKPGTVVQAYIESMNPIKGFMTPHTKCTGEWQTLNLKVRFPLLKSTPYLVLRIMGNNGSVIFINPKIQEASGTVKNGDFEQKTSHWGIKNGSIKKNDVYGNVLELKNQHGTASAIQTGIRVEKGQIYRLSYMVCGGTDSRYTDSQNMTWFRCAPRMNGSFIFGTEHWQDAPASWQKKTVTFQVPETGFLDIFCELKTSGSALFDSISLAQINSKEPLLDIIFDFPHAFRSTALIDDKRPIKGKIISKIPEAAKMEISFNNKKYQLNSTDFELPVPTQIGIYPITLTAFAESGKVLDKIEKKFFVRSSANREITFREDRIMLIDGSPFFPIGTWNIGGNKSLSDKMKLARKTGFNCVRIGGDELDDAAEHGLMGFVRVLETFPTFKNEEHRKNWLANYESGIRSIMEHPSLIGYVNSDEPAWRGIEANPIIEAYDFIKMVDPSRPVFLNEAPRGNVDDLRVYTKASDVYGVDIYPIPYPNIHSALDDKMMTSVGKYTQICRDVVRDTQPVWMTLQAFSWGAISKRPPYIYPTAAENRFMAYNAIAHGATGLFYWGINQFGVENWEYFNILEITLQELQRMTGVFVSPQISPAELSCKAPEIFIMQKRYQGKNYYIVLNESGKTISAEFNGKLTESKLYVMEENRTVSVNNGCFQDKFSPYSVHVYSDSSTLPPPIALPKTHRVTTKFVSEEVFRKANWIWYPKKNQTEGHKACFWRSFEIAEKPVSAILSVTADDHFKIWINGKAVMEHNYSRHYGTASEIDIALLLKPGLNEIAVKAADGGMAPCGLLFSLRMKFKNKENIDIVSDSKTLTSEKVPESWPKVNDKSIFVPAENLGAYGIQPWGDRTRALPALPDCGKMQFLF